MKIKLIACAILLTVASPVQASDIPDHLAIRALVGESGGQCDTELLAHACALHNRGSLQGVYGLTATHVAKEPESTFRRARIAWKQALSGVDTVGGRTEWLSDYDLKLIRTKWSKAKRDRFLSGLVNPLKIGETTFYHRRKNARNG